MKRYALSLSVLMAAAGAQAQPADAMQARSWAASCASCHGTVGKAQPGMESLAGQSKDDLVRKMQEYKTGRRPATVMHQLAKGYTDEQIDAIAAYFAAQKK
ncbi:MAG: Cytochrome subunit of sulfide dehydrogenase [Pseudomonadota bacterium]|jgi:cytochrome c553